MIELFKENKKSGRWELSEDEIVKRFSKSKFTEFDWPFERALLAFMTDPDGLNSSFDRLTDAQWDELEKARKIYVY